MKRSVTIAAIVLVFIMILIWPAISKWNVPGIIPDGIFDDWQGRAYLADTQSDGPVNSDLKTVFWGTSQNQQKLYFMIERYAPENVNNELTCRLFFDVDNDGSFESNVDKYAEVVYRPVNDTGEIVVELFSSDGSPVSSYSASWGETSGEGGRRFEFYLAMTDLGIYPAQPVKFFVSGIGNSSDRLPDKGDNLWMPFPVVTKSKPAIAIGFIIWAAIVAFCYINRIWIFYYLFGAVGFTFIAILLLRGSFIEFSIERNVGMLLHHILGYLHINTTVFDKTPGTLLVMIDVDKSWTTIDIEIESSGLLEICIFLGLMLFYPGYSFLRRLWFSLIGVAILYVSNIIRLMVVISIINWGGRDLIFLAHTLFGRIVFFALVVALYWHMITGPTLGKIRKYVNDE
ncbi:MAG: hypothetical protein ACOY46_00225 [Bacillota bacterium]